MISSMQLDLTTKGSWRLDTNPDLVLIAETNVLSPTVFSLRLLSKEKLVGLLEPSPHSALSSTKPSGTTGTLQSRACHGLSATGDTPVPLDSNAVGRLACGSLSPSAPPRVT